MTDELTYEILLQVSKELQYEDYSKMLKECSNLKPVERIFKLQACIDNPSSAYVRTAKKLLEEISNGSIC